MKSYVLSIAATGETLEGFHDGPAEAELWAQDKLEQLGHEEPWFEFGDWEADGFNDDGQPMARLLIWACEADSVNDSGEKAIATLSVVTE
jgi:hypothetical protein